MLRGGAYKPRTSPYAFQGLGTEGLRLLAEAKAQTGLPIVTELMDARDLEPVLEVADVIQIGARNMQNYALLSEVGRSDCPVLIKRGLSSTLEELLMAAEYVLKEGNENVMLCERGIRTFETAYRFTLDLTAGAGAQGAHAPAGRSSTPATRPAGARSSSRSASPPPRRAPTASSSRSTRQPEEAICDGPQQLRTEDFAEYAQKVEAAAAVAGKTAFIAAAARPLDRRGRRRRRHRRVGRAWPPAAGSAPRSAASTRAPTRRWPPGAIDEARRRPRRRARRRRRGRRRRARRRAARAPSPPSCEAAPAGLRGHRRRLDQARGRGRAARDERFVGGHPLAGTEASGVAHAREDLFDGAVWYLTPTSATSGIMLERLHRLVSGLGARPVAIDADTHDRMMAAVSHLPHVVANVLVGQAGRALGGERLPPTGPSFRDATRVAGANPALWPDIYLANRDALLDRDRRDAAPPGRRARRARRRRPRPPGGVAAGGGGRARRRCSRPAWPAGRCASCAPSCPTARASSPTSR